jgi:predicted RNase H-like nuclease (RuvC/YqgF family)
MPDSMRPAREPTERSSLKAMVHRQSSEIGRLEAESERLEAESERLREALRVCAESCADWSNDDVRDHCRAALNA